MREGQGRKRLDAHVSEDFFGICGWGRGVFTTRDTRGHRALIQDYNSGRNGNCSNYVLVQKLLHEKT